MYKSLRKSAGFNALELMMVLAVISIAIVGVVKTMSSNSDKQNSNQMITDVNAMVANIKNAYSGTNNGYADLSTQAAIDMKAVPQGLKINGETIKNQFQGGTVTIEPANNGDAFDITYTNVPQAVCASSVNTLGSSAFLSIQVNGDEVLNTATQKALSATKVAQDCASQQEKSTIIFTAS